MSTYQNTARFYDKLYQEKAYAQETEKLLRLIEMQATRPYKTLLDVGCGTGAHLIHLVKSFQCTGVDYSPAMLEIAQEKLPEMPLYEGDMRTFALSQRFDVVVSLFSAIGYMTTVHDLNTAIQNMAHHVSPGGMLVVESWFHPDQFEDGKFTVSRLDEPNLQLSRMTRSKVEGNLSVMEMNFLITSPAGFQHFFERHQMGLFTDEAYQAAFRNAGITPSVDPQGFTGRSLYSGLKEM